MGRLLPALNVYLSSSSNTTNYCNSAALKRYKNALQSSYSWLLMCVFGRFWQINRLFWIWWLTQCDSAALIWTIKVLNWYKCLFRSQRHKQAVTLHTVNNCTFALLFIMSTCLGGFYIFWKLQQKYSKATRSKEYIETCRWCLKHTVLLGQHYTERENDVSFTLYANIMAE